MKKSSPSDAASGTSVRAKNTVYIGGGKDMSLSTIADEEDLFLDFSFVANAKPTPVMSM